MENNINTETLLNESYEYNPEAELNPTIVVPDGRHLGKIKLGSRGITVGSGKTGAFIKAHVVASVSAPGERYDRRVINDDITSRIFESSKTSLVHVLLRKLGYDIPSTGTLASLKEALEQALAIEPEIGFRSRLEARANLGTEADPNWQNLGKGQKDFPVDANGYTVPFIKLPNGGVVEGRERLKDFYEVSAVSGASA